MPLCIFTSSPVDASHKFTDYEGDPPRIGEMLYMEGEDAEWRVEDVQWQFGWVHNLVAGRVIRLKLVNVVIAYVPRDHSRYRKHS